MISLNANVEPARTNNPVGERGMRVVLADDHDLVRDGLKPYIAEVADNVDVAEASSLDEVLDADTSDGPPGLILLDLNMPGMDGPESVSKVRKAFPEVPIVVISGHFDSEIISISLKNGANGFVPKTTRGKSLISALRLVLDGETYIPPAMVSGEVGRGSGEKIGGGHSLQLASDNVLAKLSEREMSILKLLIEGKTNKEIARELDLQEITIKVHLRNAYRKIGASNRADAVRIAFKSGWQ